MSRLELIETIKLLNNEDLEWLKTQIVDLQTIRNTAKLNENFDTEIENGKEETKEDIEL